MYNATCHGGTYLESELSSNRRSKKISLGGLISKTLRTKKTYRSELLFGMISELGPAVKHVIYVKDRPEDLEPTCLFAPTCGAAFSRISTRILVDISESHPGDIAPSWL